MALCKKTMIVLSVPFVFLWLGSFTVPLSHAAGMSTHLVAGKVVMDTVKDKDLKDFLARNKNMYLNGIMVPDAIMTSLDGDDGVNHGKEAPKFEHKGYTAHYLDVFFEKCIDGFDSKKTGSSECEQALSFYLGTLTHLVTDGPWHAQFIRKTSSDKCDKEKLQGECWSCERHVLIDTDLDLCFSKLLNGGKGDMPLIGRGEYAKAKQGGFPLLPERVFPGPAPGRSKQGRRMLAMPG